MWALLGELAKSVNWHGQHLEDFEWKDVMTAALRKQRAVPGIDGGFVILGTPTKRMSKAFMTELIELIYAFGSQQGVEFKQ